ncbi:MAG: tRNA pseudouridine(38-40) synthase TruA [Planctomycetota bacterium]
MSVADDRRGLALDEVRPASPRRRVVLAYDGGAYAGWQTQPGQRTIQGEIEGALARILGGPVRLFASGRTDAGVHAWGQVAHFDDPTGVAPARLCAALNALLPPDIRARELSVMEPEFHARYDALGKTYVYQWHLVPGARTRRELMAGLPPHRRATFMAAPAALDLSAMRAAARMLVGRHDFTALSRGGMDPQRGTERTLTALRVLRIPHGLRLFATADGFLYGMVRMLAGLLLQIGTGRRRCSDVPRLLAAADRSRAPPSLPPHALFLWRVRYGSATSGGTCYAERPGTR